MKSCSTTKAVLLALRTNLFITLAAIILCSESRYALGSSIAPKYPGTVFELLQDKLKEIITHQSFLSEVVKPLAVNTLFDNEVQKLSGEELQRVALVLALGKQVLGFQIQIH